MASARAASSRWDCRGKLKNFFQRGQSYPANPCQVRYGQTPTKKYFKAKKWPGNFLGREIGFRNKS